MDVTDRRSMLELLDLYVTSREVGGQLYLAV